MADTAVATAGCTTTMSPKWRRSVLTSPATNTPTVRITEIRALDENVEKNSATAVSSAISAVMASTAIIRRGSTAGATQDKRTFSGDIHRRHARTAYSAAAMAQRFTEIVSTSPRYLPTMNSQRGSGLA